LEQPEFLPDKFDSGTQNTLGILSLAVAAEELLRGDLSLLRKKEIALTSRFLDGARNIPGLVIHGPGKAEDSLPLVSVSSASYDCALLARDLFDHYGIITRPGLHCAPLAHQCAGTFPAGTLRFSFGPETTVEEIDSALTGLETLLAKSV
jgi:selenocysteine lyase/cysteine desulfurase